MVQPARRQPKWKQAAQLSSKCQSVPMATTEKRRKKSSAHRVRLLKKEAIELDGAARKAATKMETGGAVVKQMSIGADGNDGKKKKKIFRAQGAPIDKRGHRAGGRGRACVCREC